jgi:hypothetical protein
MDHELRKVGTSQPNPAAFQAVWFSVGFETSKSPLIAPFINMKDLKVKDLAPCTYR